MLRAVAPRPRADTAGRGQASSASIAHAAAGARMLQPVDQDRRGPEQSALRVNPNRSKANPPESKSKAKAERRRWHAPNGEPRDRAGGRRKDKGCQASQGTAEAWQVSAFRRGAGGRRAGAERLTEKTSMQPGTQAEPMPVQPRTDSMVTRPRHVETTQVNQTV